jgi:hypothetical protein
MRPFSGTSAAGALSTALTLQFGHFRYPSVENPAIGHHFQNKDLDIPLVMLPFPLSKDGKQYEVLNLECATPKIVAANS